MHIHIWMWCDAMHHAKMNTVPFFSTQNFVWPTIIISWFVILVELLSDFNKIFRQVDPIELCDKSIVLSFGLVILEYYADSMIG